MSRRLTHVMEAAVAVATFSPDPSVQNGAVVLDRDAAIAGWGCNRFPLFVDDTPGERWERPAKYLWVEHAERNAIYMAAKHGIPTAGGTLVCPWAACADCARAIIQAGIERLVRFPMPHVDRWSESIAVGEQMLTEARVEILELSMDDVDVHPAARIGQVVR